jgi:hypothetical protein
MFAAVLLVVILAFDAVNTRAVIDLVLGMAVYTYGPLLGLFGFGLFTGWRIRDRFTPAVCIASPLLCGLLDTHSQQWLGGYQFGFELLILNGAITFAGLCALRTARHDSVPAG